MTKSALWRALLLAFVFAFSQLFDHAGAQDPVSNSKLKLQPCEVSAFAMELPGSFECGVYEVYENRKTQKGKRIALNVIVARATGEDVRPDPIFYFAGGPGQATSASSIFAAIAAPHLRHERDMVFVDARGTGKSGALNCPLPKMAGELQSFMFPHAEPDRFRRCLPNLRERADLRQYTTSIIVDDVNEVRAALGYDKINLWGGSYGSRPVLEMLRRHPAHVRSAIIQGVSPPSEPGYDQMAPHAQKGLLNVIENCRRQKACAEAFPDINEDIKKVLEHMKSQPVSTTVRNQRTQKQEPVRITLKSFAYLLRPKLYTVQGMRDIPLILHEAANGNESPLAESLLRVGARYDALNWGMWASVVCAESAPILNIEKARRLAERSVIGSFYVDDIMEICSFWPRGEIPPGFHEPVSSDIPIMMMAGELDASTPKILAEQIVSSFPNGRLIVFSNSGHVLGNSQACADRLEEEFYVHADVSKLEAGCIDDAELPDYFVTVDEWESAR